MRVLLPLSASAKEAAPVSPTTVVEKAELGEGAVDPRNQRPRQGSRPASPTLVEAEVERGEGAVLPQRLGQGRQKDHAVLGKAGSN